MQIKVTVGTNTNRKDVIVDNARVIKEVLSENGVNYSSTTVHLDGCPLGASELNGTFAQAGINDSCYLMAVVKADNAS